jgi:leucyl-tRNA synthetase family protein
MAVPAHDTRDFDFAKKYKLEIIESISNWKNDNWYTYEKAFTNLWTLVNSWDFDWLSSKEAQKELIKFSTKNWFWEKKINYKLRDWLFSRQRYWWEPIPLIHLDITQLKNLTHISNISEASDNNLAYILKRPPVNWESSCDSTTCSWMVRELIIWWKVFSKIYDWIYWKIICDYNLPLKLPKVENYKPSWDWKSPLNKVEDFVNIKLADNLVAKRETNTMPQWWGSCWYYLRYMNPDNIDKLVDPEVEKYWWQVDSYVGWSEHAVLHLLYARFWHKFLFDIWVVSNDEPFKRLKNQWLIQSHVYDTNKWQSIHMDLIEEKDWKYYHKETKEQLEKKIWKMSKSLWNVVNPDDIVEEYWADSFRLYEMYLSDFKDAAPWNTTGILWVKRFLEKSERLFWKEAKISTQDDNFTIKLLNKTIKKVEEDIENYKFNTAISSLMILVNNWLPNTLELQSIWKKTFIVLLHPFAPYLSEELWEKIWNTSSVFFSSWPEYDDKLIIDNNIKIAIQVLGKVRATIEINKDESKDSVLQKAKQNPNILKWIEWKKLIKEIYIPWKIVNLVVK